MTQVVDIHRVSLDQSRSGATFRSGAEGQLTGNYSGPEVLVLYLKRPRAKSGELKRCGGALRIQRLEGSRPAGLWDLYLDGAVLIVCERAVAVRSLGFQERVAERTGVGKRIRESESHHHTAF